MRSIQNEIIKELYKNGGEYMGVEDLINKIPGDPDWIRSNIKELEDRAIVIRSSDNCHGGRGHKRSIKLIDYRSIPL